MAPLLTPEPYLRRLTALLASLVIGAAVLLACGSLFAGLLLARIQTEAAGLEGYKIPKLHRDLKIERDGATLLTASLSGPAVLRAQTATHAELDLRLSLEPDRLDLRKLLEVRINKQVAPLARLGRFQSASARLEGADIAIAVRVPVTLSLGFLPGAEQTWTARIDARATPEVTNGQLSLRLRYRSLSFDTTTPPGMLKEARSRARERLNRRLQPQTALPEGWRVLAAEIQDGVLVMRVSYRHEVRPWFCSPRGLKSPLVCGFLQGLAWFGQAERP